MKTKLLYQKAKGRGKRGMTIVEYTIAAALLSLVVGTLITSSQNMITARSSESTRVLLQKIGDEAIQSIVSDLRVSGFDQVLGTGNQ